MSAIKINRIEPYQCEAFDPDGNSLGMLNDFEFNDLRIQIKQNKAEGYYMKPDEHTICNLTPDGRCDYWPKGFYDKWEWQLMELL